MTEDVASLAVSAAQADPLRVTNAESGSFQDH